MSSRLNRYGMLRDGFKKLSWEIQDEIQMSKSKKKPKERSAERFKKMNLRRNPKKFEKWFNRNLQKLQKS